MQIWMNWEKHRDLEPLNLQITEADSIKRISWKTLKKYTSKESSW